MQLPPYYPDYFLDDPRIRYFPTLDVRRIDVPSGRALLLSSTLDRGFGGDAFTGSYLRPLGTRHQVDLFVDRPGCPQYALSLQRAHGTRDFSAREVRLLELIAPDFGRMLSTLEAEAELGGTAFLVDGRRTDEDDGGLAATDGLGEQVAEHTGRSLLAHARSCRSELIGRGARAGDAVERVLRARVGWVRLRCCLLDDASPTCRAVASTTRVTCGASHFELMAREVRLSPRERDVARLAVRGLSDRELASATGITVSTVKTHLRSVYRKTRAPGRSALAALLLGVIEPASGGPT